MNKSVDTVKSHQRFSILTLSNLFGEHFTSHLWLSMVLARAVAQVAQAGGKIVILPFSTEQDSILKAASGFIWPL